jgi:hypothetical protein
MTMTFGIIQLHANFLLLHVSWDSLPFLWKSLVHSDLSEQRWPLELEIDL